MKKAQKKSSTKRSSAKKPAAKSSTAAKASAPSRTDVGRYTPREIQSIGWKPFRYPPE
jgi:hypothetical protein